MQSLLVSHTQRYHKHYRSGGHVWQGRFKSPVIQNDEHLLTVSRYIEANPLRAALVARGEDYPWSSFASMAWEVLTGFSLDPFFRSFFPRDRFFSLKVRFAAPEGLP